MHAINPVQRLRLLRDRLARQTAETAGPEWIFHAEMSEIFHSVRDLHTNYLLPEPFSGKIAYLPFLVEEYQDEGGNFYVVSHIMQGFSAPGFERGAEITHWSGIPIQRAVDLNAARFAGSNPAARHSRGVQSLTIRPLRIHLPPNEEWVTLSYVGTDGTPRELREPWRVVDNLPPLADADAVSPQAAAPVDLGADEASRAQRRCSPQTVAQELAPGHGRTDAALDLVPQVPGRSVTHLIGRSRIRIFTFSASTRGRVRERIHPADRAAPRQRTDRRRAGQRRRAHLRERIHAADADAAADPARAGSVHQHASQPADLPEAQRQPGRHRPGPMVPLDGSGSRDGSDVLQRVPDLAC
jgi:hypothetical protein